MSDSASNQPETIYDEEHRQLRDSVDRLRRGVDEAHQRALAAIEAFERFHTSLKNHFAAEEGDGAFFDEIVSQAPRLSGRADKLRAEHDAMLKLIDELEDDLKLEEFVPWASIDAQLSNLAETLFRHEAEERELVQIAFTEDVGNKD
ncbi:MAG: hemerythrin domain-containing protein [Pirellulales bacterium]|nr:hemerythrin domain-containing protein [Planctomycetales bacterium]